MPTSDVCTHRCLRSPPFPSLFWMAFMASPPTLLCVLFSYFSLSAASDVKQRGHPPQPVTKRSTGYYDPTTNGGSWLTVRASLQILFCLSLIIQTIIGCSKYLSGRPRRTYKCCHTRHLRLASSRRSADKWWLAKLLPVSSPFLRCQCQDAAP